MLAKVNLVVRGPATSSLEARQLCFAFSSLRPGTERVSSSAACKAQRRFLSDPLEARRQSHSQASTRDAETRERSSVVDQLYKQLAEVAREGRPDAAQVLLQDLIDRGLDVTPQAYHGLIFAYMRAGDSQAALNALYAALNTGALKPLAASYAVVIYACAVDCDFRSAETVYNLVASGGDRYPSWVAYLQGLTSAGLVEEDKGRQLRMTQRVEEILEEGGRQDWFPDADLCEDILGLLCEDPKKALAAEQLLDELEQREGAETRHYNCVLRAHAVWMGVHNARSFMTDMIEGQTIRSRRIYPNIESYNALLEGCLVERMQGFSFAIEDLEEVVAEMVTVGHKANKRTHGLLLMFHMTDGKLDRALFELREMERLAAPGRATEQLPDEWLARLFDFLLHQKCVLEVARLLFVLKRDARPLPSDAILLDADGASFHTRWLRTFFAGQHANRRTAGLDKYRESEIDDDEDALLVDDAYIGAGNVVVDESGAAVAVGSMSASQLRAELEAKGMATKGLRKKELFRQVQHSRGAEPTSVREIMRKRERERELNAQKDARNLKRLQAKQQLKSLTTVAKYTGDRSLRGERVNLVEYETMVIDPGAEAEEEDKELLNSLATLGVDDPTKELLEDRHFVSTTEVEDQLLLDTILFDTDAPGFQARNPHFNGREGYGIRMTWPKYGRAARLAFYMMEMGENLGAGASLKDFLEIQSACIEESDASTAFALLFKLHPHARNISDDSLELFYSKTLLLCMQTNRLELAAVVSEAMRALDLQPLGIVGHADMLPALADLGSGLQRLIRDIQREAGAPVEGEDSQATSDAEAGGEAGAAPEPVYDYSYDARERDFYVDEAGMQMLLDRGLELASGSDEDEDELGAGEIEDGLDPDLESRLALLAEGAAEERMAAEEEAAAELSAAYITDVLEHVIEDVSDDSDVDSDPAPADSDDSDEVSSPEPRNDQIA